MPRTKKDTCKNGHPTITPESRYKQGGCVECIKAAPHKRRLREGRILPATTPVTVNVYKEPLTPFTEGYGYMGTLAQNEAKTHVQCHLCGLLFTALGTHLRQYHKMSADEYREKFQLSRGTGLVSDTARARYIAANLSRSSESKRQSLESILKNRHIGPYKSTWRRSLEKKNKDGRCPDQLVDKIQQLATKKGGVPSKRDFQAEYGGGHISSVLREFGSWKTALNIAGLTPTTQRGGSKGTHYTRESVIELAKEFFELNGRVPRANDLGQGFLPSTSVLHRLFNGSIIELRRAAGMGAYDYVNEDGSTEQTVAY